MANESILGYDDDDMTILRLVSTIGFVVWEQLYPNPTISAK